MVDYRASNGFKNSFLPLIQTAITAASRSMSKRGRERERIFALPAGVASEFQNSISFEHTHTHSHQHVHLPVSYTQHSVRVTTRKQHQSVSAWISTQWIKNGYQEASCSMSRLLWTGCFSKINWFRWESPLCYGSKDCLRACLSGRVAKNRVQFRSVFMCRPPSLRLFCAVTRPVVSKTKHLPLTHPKKDSNDGWIDRQCNRV